MTDQQPPTDTTPPPVSQHGHQSPDVYSDSSLDTPLSGSDPLPHMTTNNPPPHHAGFGNGPIQPLPTHAFFPPIPPPPPSNFMQQFPVHYNHQYHQQVVPGPSAGPHYDAFGLEAMKVGRSSRLDATYSTLNQTDPQRALDVLPPNPLNGIPPQIDGSSTFNNAPPKRTRHSPTGFPGSPNGFSGAPNGYPCTSNGFPGSPNGAPIFTPRVPGAYQSSPGYADQPGNPHPMQAPQSPIHLGGPLSTPTQPSLSSPNMNPSPYMGMMGMGFGAYPYMVSLSRKLCSPPLIRSTLLHRLCRRP